MDTVLKILRLMPQEFNPNNTVESIIEEAMLFGWQQTNKKANGETGHRLQFNYSVTPEECFISGEDSEPEPTSNDKEMEELMNTISKEAYAASTIEFNAQTYPCEGGCYDFELVPPLAAIWANHMGGVPENHQLIPNGGYSYDINGDRGKSIIGVVSISESALHHHIGQYLNLTGNYTIKVKHPTEKNRGHISINTI